MVIYDGEGWGGWFLDWGKAQVGVPDRAAGDRLSLGGLVPGSAGAGSRAVRFSLANAEPARLRMFEVTGRAVWSRDVALGAGEHDLPVPELASLSSGIYFLRLEQSGRSVGAKAVLLH
jgi:hypothetical protein